MSVTEFGLHDRGFATLHREEVVRRVSRRVATVLDTEDSSSNLDFSGVPDGPNWELESLESGCTQSGVYTRRVDVAEAGQSGDNQIDSQQALDLLREGHIIIVKDEDGGYTILERQLGRDVEISLVQGSLQHRTIPRGSVDKLLLGSRFAAASSPSSIERQRGDEADSHQSSRSNVKDRNGASSSDGQRESSASDSSLMPSVLVASRELSCASLTSSLAGRIAHLHGNASAHGGHEPGDEAGEKGHGAHDHPTPLRRFLQLLRLEASDIGTVILFALVSGILALATPLAVESLVNVVSWGTYLQPLIVLALVLLASLGLAGVLKILQTVVVEIIQRRQFVRIVGDLAHRFPRARRANLKKYYPRELANRVFDIMTIQKATAVLLLDGVSIVLTTTLGLALLAFYHPFLLGFNIALMLTMVTLTFLLGRGGISTSIEESIAKYKIAHWLQDVISYPGAFKINGGEDLAIETANGLAAEYLAARERQFRVVIRQVTFAIGLQVFASTALLGLGGWLVIARQLTLGQLVASELVVTVVVGAFAKAGKSLEKYYDLMAGIDKVGHLLDLPVDPRRGRMSLSDEPARIQWTNLKLDSNTSTTYINADEVEPGKTLAVCGDDLIGRGLFLESIAGLIDPTAGVVSVEEMDATEAALAGQGRLIAIANRIEVFHGSVMQNVELGRPGIGINRVREVLVAVGLWDSLHELPQGASTVLQTGGYPLTHDQLARLMIARAIATRPKLLVIDGLLDDLPKGERMELWSSIQRVTTSLDSTPSTIVIGTDDDRVRASCDQFLEVS